jgi:hypothetical protein
MREGAQDSDCSQSKLASSHGFNSSRRILNRFGSGRPGKQLFGEFCRPSIGPADGKRRLEITTMGLDIAKSIFQVHAMTFDRSEACE